MDRFLVLEEVLDRLRVSRQTLRRMEARGDFPERVRISPQRVGWLQSEVEDYFKSLSSPDRPRTSRAR